MHSEKFELVKKYYKSHLWNEAQTRNAVSKHWITEIEFYEITGKVY